MTIRYDVLRFSRMATYQLPDQVHYRVVAEEAVILQRGGGQVLGLNRTGTRVLELLADGATEVEAVDRLLAEVEANPEALASDVRHFIEQLIDAGVIVAAEVGSEPVEQGFTT